MKELIQGTARLPIDPAERTGGSAPPAPGGAVGFVHVDCNSPVPDSDGLVGLILLDGSAAIVF